MVDLEKENETEPLRDGIEHAKIATFAIKLKIDLDTLGGLSKRDVEDCHCQ